MLTVQLTYLLTYLTAYLRTATNINQRHEFDDFIAVGLNPRFNMSVVAWYSLATSMCTNKA